MTMGGLRRRFYREVAAAREGDGFVVRLDGRPLKTPGGAILKVGMSTLAEAIAEEWAVQKDLIDPRGMPMTRLVNTALDRVAVARNVVVDALAAYGSADLLCYRAEGPADLVARQAKEWQPLLDWAADRHGARFLVTTGIIHVAQPDDALARIREAIAALDDWTLTAAAALIPAVGSAVLTLALIDGRLDAAGTCACAFLDEDWQRERWGEDAEATRRRQGLIEEINAAERFLALVRAA